MGKIRWIIVTVTILVTNGFAGVLTDKSLSLEKNCLTCHRTQKIPSDLIYRRYLMKYSTPKRMEKAIFAYLNHPQKEHSIMPPQFFLKFPMKNVFEMNDETLLQNIRAYIEKFNLKKRLFIEE